MQFIYLVTFQIRCNYQTNHTKNDDWFILNSLKLCEINVKKCNGIYLKISYVRTKKLSHEQLCITEVEVGRQAEISIQVPG